MRSCGDGRKVPSRFKRCRRCRACLASTNRGAEIKSVLFTGAACARHRSPMSLQQEDEARLLLQQQQQQQQQRKTKKTAAKRRRSGSSSSSSNGPICESYEEEEEEARLQLRQGDDDGGVSPWGSLPADLIDRILCHLPVPAFARLQFVCKHWSAKLSSTDSTFLHLHAQNPQSRNPWLVVSKHSPDFHGLSAFDPCAKRWFRIRFSFEGMPWTGSMCAASGGLFCLLDISSLHFDTGLVVCNPLTRQWRMLPALPVTPGNGGFVVAITTDPSTAAYKVVVITDVGELWQNGNLCVQYLPLVYDSASGAWQNGNIGLACTSSYTTSRSFISNGTLYAVTCCGKYLLSYNMETDSWTETRLKLPARQLVWEGWGGNVARLPFIVECQERLFLVARLERGGLLGTLQRRFSLGRLPITLHNIVGLSELPPNPTHRVKLVTYTPLHWMEELVVASEGTDFLVASDGDHCIWLLLAGSHSMLTYDVNSRKWSLRKPGCPGEDCLDEGPRKAVFAPLMWTASV